jgi:hypothetical protein
MDPEQRRRLEGIHQLIHDGVDIGSRFVEGHHRRAASKPFRVLGAIPVISGPASIVRSVHDAIVTVTYTSIRAVNQGFRVGSSWLVRRHDAP